MNALMYIQHPGGSTWQICKQLSISVTLTEWNITDDVNNKTEMERTGSM